MNPERSIEESLCSILERFESGETNEARAGIRALAEYLVRSKSKLFGTSKLLEALDKARHEGDRGAAFYVQTALDDWLQPKPKQAE